VNCVAILVSSFYFSCMRRRKNFSMTNIANVKKEDEWMHVMSWPLRTMCKTTLACFGRCSRPQPFHPLILVNENQTKEEVPSYINGCARSILFNRDQILESVECRGKLERSAMAKFSNSAVVLLMLLIAAWRTTPVLSHFFQPSKPAAGSDFDYGRRYVP
jgi:hypothetical protein